MLRDEVIKYYYPGNNLNFSCSESMIRALNDYYDLKLPEEMMLSASAFSGGCWHDEMCGGLAAGAAALGLLYSINGHGHDSEKMRLLVRQLFTRLEEELGSSRCKYLKAHHYVPGRKCEAILVKCADILEDLISNNEIINRR